MSENRTIALGGGRRHRPVEVVLVLVVEVGLGLVPGLGLVSPATEPGLRSRPRPCEVIGDAHVAATHVKPRVRCPSCVGLFALESKDVTLARTRRGEHPYRRVVNVTEQDVSEQDGPARTRIWFELHVRADQRRRDEYALAAPANRAVAVDTLEMTVHDVGRLDETTGVATTRRCVHLRGWSLAESLVWTLLVVLAAKQLERALLCTCVRTRR